MGKVCEFRTTKAAAPNEEASEYSYGLKDADTILVISMTDGQGSSHLFGKDVDPATAVMVLESLKTRIILQGLEL